MPQTYTMKDTLRAADRAAQEIEAFLRARPETTRVQNVETDPEYWEMDVDLIWETRRGTYKVEIKGDRLGHKTGNFFFETHSNRERGTPGCFLYSAADLFFYYFIETGTLYILPLPNARAWFLERQQEFEERAATTPIGRGVGEARKTYTTVGRLVPVERALREIPGVWHARLAAPDAKPFLKWAGGKRQLLPHIAASLPAELGGALTTYVEPFLGSGAVFFHLARRYAFTRILLADQNPDLILAWRAVQAHPDELIARLQAIQSAYFALDLHRQRHYYYQTRAAFNAAADPDPAARAAQLIFLNRTCYNGLFRVNARGEFNVPFGSYKNPKICDAPNLQAVSAALAGVEIVHGDFEAARPACDSRTFVSLDPPYRPLTPTASFNAYDKNGFGDAEQVRLAGFFGEMDRRGARLMLSNADPRNSDPLDDFFDSLYGAYRIQRVPAARQINSDPQKRGPINELLITNY
jgi:DNA adenine methylase